MAWSLIKQIKAFKTWYVVRHMGKVTFYLTIENIKHDITRYEETCRPNAEHKY